MRAVVEDAYHRAVLHRPACEVAHAFVGAFAVEVAALEVGKCSSDGFGFADGREGAYSVIDMFGNVDGNVAAVAFGPPFCQR